MSAELPTEEDVLCVLLLWQLECDAADDGSWELFFADDRALGIPDGAGWVALDRWTEDGLSSPIADSERRLEVEHCEQEVVAAAECEAVTSSEYNIAETRRAVERLWAARRALEGK